MVSVILAGHVRYSVHRGIIGKGQGLIITGLSILLRSARGLRAVLISKNNEHSRGNRNQPNFKSPKHTLAPPGSDPDVIRIGIFH